MGKSATVTRQGEDYFLTVQAPAPRLTLIGAVHISQALAPMARIAGLDPSIIDPRTAFATPGALSRNAGHRQMAGRSARGGAA